MAEGICLRAGQIAVAEAALTRWISKFDRRGGLPGPGMLSCAHWLSWRAGMSLGTARDRVRVARRLAELPQLAEAFGGRVSYAKVQAITRVAEPDDPVDWVELARHRSAAQLEKIVRGVNGARANEASRLDREQAAWTLRTTVRYDEHGNFTMTVRGPAQFLPVVQALPGRGGLLRLRRVPEIALRRFDLDRGQHDVSLPLRELLDTLDGERCRFPGCTRRKRLHAHHIVF